MQIIGSFCGQGKPKIMTRSYQYLNVMFSGVCRVESLPRNRQLEGQTHSHRGDFA
jgi:hypothetical protein